MAAMKEGHEIARDFSLHLIPGGQDSPASITDRAKAR